MISVWYHGYCRIKNESMFLEFFKIVFLIILCYNKNTDAIKLSGIDLLSPNNEFIEKEIYGGVNINNLPRDPRFCSFLSEELRPKSLDFRESGWQQLNNSDSDKYSRQLVNNPMVTKDPNRIVQREIDGKDYIIKKRNAVSVFPLFVPKNMDFIKTLCDNSLKGLDDSARTENLSDEKPVSKKEEKVTLMQLEKENQDSMLKQFRENQRRLRPILIIQAKSRLPITFNDTYFKRNTYPTILGDKNGELNNVKINNYSRCKKNSLCKHPIEEEYISETNKKIENLVKSKRSIYLNFEDVINNAEQNFKNRNCLPRSKHSIFFSNENLKIDPMKLKSKSSISGLSSYVRTKHQEILRNKNGEYFSSLHKHTNTDKNHKNKIASSEKSSILDKERHSKFKSKFNLKSKHLKSSKKLVNKGMVVTPEGGNHYLHNHDQKQLSKFRREKSTIQNDQDYLFGSSTKSDQVFYNGLISSPQYTATNPNVYDGAEDISKLTLAYDIHSTYATANPTIAIHSLKKGGGRIHSNDRPNPNSKKKSKNK